MKTERGFRRGNLRRFPCHLLYEAGENFIRVMHVRHHKAPPGLQQREEVIWRHLRLKTAGEQIESGDTLN
ncbi:MAG TPA: hypothetical protein VK633_08795 [Verrucomicrobiae bacterium]|nr:hypothetical protein [Verrucomicrobiae bacterium]